jgi:hypothetical protein
LIFYAFASSIHFKIFCFVFEIMPLATPPTPSVACVPLAEAQRQAFQRFILDMLALHPNFRFLHARVALGVAIQLRRFDLLAGLPVDTVEASTVAEIASGFGALLRDVVARRSQMMLNIYVAAMYGSVFTQPDKIAAINTVIIEKWPGTIGERAVHYFTTRCAERARA